MNSRATRGLPVLPLFESAFTTAATFVRARLLGVAAILTTGRRTVANLVRTVAGLTEGDPSSYHRVLSLAQWSDLSLGLHADCWRLSPEVQRICASACPGDGFGEHSHLIHFGVIAAASSSCLPSSRRLYSDRPTFQLVSRDDGSMSAKRKSS
jgi:hypothetical protein